MDLLQCLMDSSSHAIFTLDRDGIITHINQQAKVRFGLYHNSQHPHPAGRLEPGDLVLIADTAIGADDYMMKPFDSKELVARVKAVLRRYQAVPKAEDPAEDKGKCVEYPGIVINLTT